MSQRIRLVEDECFGCRSQLWELDEVDEVYFLACLKCYINYLKYGDIMKKMFAP